MFINLVCVSMYSMARVLKTCAS